jgi:hypothetical protein
MSIGESEIKKTLQVVLPVVQLGIIDQTLPANSSTGFFKVNTHDNAKVFFASLVVCDQLLSCVSKPPKTSV